MFSCFPSRNKKKVTTGLYKGSLEEVFKEHCWVISSKLIQTGNQAANMQTVAEKLIADGTKGALNICVGEQGFEGIEHIANAVAKNSSLNWIGIDYDASNTNSHPVLTWEQAKALANMIKENKQLNRLRLAGLNDASALYIAEALSHNNTIKELDILSNSMTEAGIRTILNALKSNEGLEQIEMLCEKSLSEAVTNMQSEIDQILKENHTAHVVRLLADTAERRVLVHKDRGLEFLQRRRQA